MQHVTWSPVHSSLHLSLTVSICLLPLPMCLLPLPMCLLPLPMCPLASPHVPTCLSPPPPLCLSPCVHLSLRFPLSYANTLMPSHLPCFFPPHTQVVPFNPAVDVTQGLYLRFNSALKAANPYSLLTPPSLPPHTQAVPSDPAVDVTLGLYLRFNSALKAANPAIKTLLSISSDFVITNLFDNAASSPSSRSAFIQSAIALARKYNFDGLDLNLAYTTGNATLVSALLTDFRAAIESEAAEPGILFYKEIDELVTTGGYTATFDAPTSSMYAVKGDQWVGYDDPSTIATKVQFAKSQGYGGWFFWALGQDANNALLNAAVAA
ncbi:unnamed protein product [Closterium sp. Naga37s-1]|nr:unnamed protein product [Closterium sp. Naga37s-1]